MAGDGGVSRILLDGLQKVIQRLGVFGLTLQGVADVVEQLGVALVDAQSGDEDGLLRFPVKVASVRLKRVEGQQEQQRGAEQLTTPAPPFDGQASGIEFGPAVTDQDAEAHGRHVQHSLGHYESDRKEQVGSRYEGQNEPGEGLQ